MGVGEGGGGMKMIVMIGRDGVARNLALVNENAFPLFGTGKALEKIREAMLELGAVCLRCGIITRSEEMTNGVCNPGTGCWADVDSHLIGPQLGEEAAAESQMLPLRLWKGFLDTLPRRGEYLDVPPDQEKQGGGK